MADGRTLYVILSANAAAYKAALKGASRDTKQFGDDVDDMGRRIDQNGKEVDKLSGRIRILMDALSLVGPATVPIAAVAVPAIAGLANQLGLAVVAAGSAMLAFRGIGDVLKTMKATALDPSAANLTKLSKQLNELSPAARAFVEELRGMGDVVDQMSAAAATGLFPGLTSSLDDLRNMAGPLADLFEESAGALGDMAAEWADGFDSDRGREFVSFLEGEVRPGLNNMFRTVGNLTAGLGEMWMAFDPVNDDFGDWLLRVSEDFDRWASDLDQTQGFEDFVAYLRESGPEVAETMGALGNMLLQVVEAAAPMGGPVLDGLEAIADVISDIADSPLGPVLFSAAAAATLLNRGLQVTSSLLTKMGVQQTAVAGGGMFAAGKATSAQMSSGIGMLGTQADQARGKVRALGGDLRTMTTTMMTSGAKSGREMERFNAASGRTKATLGGLAKGAGTAGLAVGAMAVLTTGAGEKVHATNTAMLGMVGTMAGPWGAALGVGVGYLLDWKDAANDASDATKAFDAAVSGDFTSMSAYSSAVAKLTADAEGYAASVSSPNLGGQLAKSLTAGGLRNNLQVLGTARAGMGGLEFDVEDTDMGRQATAADKAKESSEDLRLAGVVLAKQLGVVSQSTDASRITTEQLDAALQAAQPAMAALGLSTEDLIRGIKDGSFVGMLDQIEGWQTRADSAAGRTHAFADSVEALGYDALATADSAAIMGSALDALLSPTLTAEEATDAWHKSLQALRAELNDDAGFKGFGEAAMKNRELTRGYVNDSKTRLTALAGLSTTTERDMANAVQATRKEFIRSGIAAGFSRKEITKRANALGLTPRMIRTVFRNAGITQADLNARKLREVYRSLDKDVRTDIRANGIPQTKAEVDALVKKYHLTEKQRVALMRIKDLASKPIGDVLKKLGILDKAHPEASVGVDNSAARNGIAAVNQWLAGINGKTATTYVRTVNTSGHGPQAANGGIWSGGVRAYANGGFSAGGRYHSRTPQIVQGGANILWGEEETGWEAYISGKPGMEARNVGILKAAAGRFGYSLVERRGGEFVQPGRGGGGHTVVQAGFPDKVDLVVDGNRFTAHIRAHAADVVRNKIAAVNDADVSTDRRDWR